MTEPLTSPLVQCGRCAVLHPGLAAPPFRASSPLAELGREIHARVCARCWRAWLAASVKLVNETRLDPTEPHGQRVWVAQMRAYLNLAEPGASRDPWARFLDRRVRLETLDGAVVDATVVALDPDRLVLAELAGASDAVDRLVRAATDDRRPGGVALARDAVLVIELAGP